MGCEEDRDAALAQAIDQLMDVPGSRRVQAGGRLIEEQDLRVTEQRAGQGNPLAKALGQGAARVIGAPGQPDRLEGLPLQIALGRGKVKVGGGTLPKSVMSSVTIEIVPRNWSLADFAARLRTFNLPVIGYIANERFKLDLRTIFAQQDDLVVDAIRATCAKTP